MTTLNQPQPQPIIMLSHKDRRATEPPPQRPTTNHKSPSPSSHSAWQKWADQTSQQKTQRKSLLRQRIVVPKKRQQDLMVEHDIPPQVEASMQLTRHDDTPTERLLLSDGFSISHFEQEIMDRPRFVRQESLQRDVIRSMRAYMQEGFREPKHPRRTRRKHRQSMSSSYSGSEKKDELALLRLSSTLLKQQDAILQQIQRDRQEQQSRERLELEDATDDLIDEEPTRHIHRFEEAKSRRQPSLGEVQQQPEPRSGSHQGNELTFQVGQRSIKVLSSESVQHAAQQGQEIISLLCIACENALHTTVSATVVYCPDCGTLAHADTLRRL